MTQRVFRLCLLYLNDFCDDKHTITDQLIRGYVMRHEENRVPSEYERALLRFAEIERP
jgi:hypothetical protein